MIADVVFLCSFCPMHKLQQSVKLDGNEYAYVSAFLSAHFHRGTRRKQRKEIDFPYTFPASLLSCMLSGVCVAIFLFCNLFLQSLFYRLSLYLFLPSCTPGPGFVARAVEWRGVCEMVNFSALLLRFFYY